MNLPKWQHIWKKPIYIKDIEGTQSCSAKTEKDSAKMARQSLFTFDRLITNKQSCYRKKDSAKMATPTPKGKLN